MNITIDKIAEIHAAAIEFMEEAKRVFPERNGARNPDGSFMGWNVWKFHAILHKAMDILLYGWSENVSAQSAECAHKVFKLVYMCPHLLIFVYIRSLWTCPSPIFLTSSCQTNVKDVQK